MDELTKKEWEKPALLVLTRSKPEESVLMACKHESFGIGATGVNFQCNQDVSGFCGACPIYAAS